MKSLDLDFSGRERTTSYLYPRRRVWNRAPRIAARFGCFVLAAGLALTVARATVVPWMSLEDMAAKAEVIVLGTVESAVAGWSDDGRMIVTRTTVVVERPLKGGPRARVVIESPGGKVGELAMVAPGAPAFRAGERVVLFLEPGGGAAAGGAAGRDASPRHGVVGWNQGRMTVRRDPATGRDLVEDRTAGTLYLDRQGRPVGPGASGKGPAELQRFLRDIETLVAGAPPGRTP